MRRSSGGIREEDENRLPQDVEVATGRCDPDQMVMPHDAVAVDVRHDRRGHRGKKGAVVRAVVSGHMCAVQRRRIDARPHRMHRQIDRRDVDRHSREGSTQREGGVDAQAGRSSTCRLRTAPPFTRRRRSIRALRGIHLLPSRCQQLAAGTSQRPSARGGSTAGIERTNAEPRADVLTLPGGLGRRNE